MASSISSNNLNSNDQHTVRKYVYTRWEETGFPKRVNHSVTSVLDENGNGFMYSLGGFKGKGQVSRGYEQWPFLGRVPMDVVELNLGQKEWKKLYPMTDTGAIDNKSDNPIDSPLFGSPDPGGIPGRYAHSCVYFQGKIYLYGGRNDVRFFENVECFDPVTGQWSVVQAVNEYGEVLPNDELPVSRYAHACSLDGHTMYIQGGTQSKWTGHFFTIVYTDDIYSFNLLSRVWRKENVICHDYPLCRDFHTGQYLNGKFYVFGGKCEVSARQRGDIDDPGFYSYDFDTQKWSQLLISGYSPPGRRSLQSVKYGQESIIYFGGFSSGLKIFYSDLFLMNTVTNHVTKIEPYGLCPSPRRRVGLCLLGTDLIICGGVGRDNSKTDLITYNDMYILSLVPSLQFLCMDIIIDKHIPTDNLPLPLRQSLHEMSCIPYVDSQKLCDTD